MSKPIYNIGSEKGYNIANSLAVGQSQTVGDGSVWTKNAQGGIDVVHQGQQMIGQITYQPQTQASRDPLSQGSSYQQPQQTQQPSTQKQQTVGNYNIGSQKGYELANSLTPGQSTTASDGSVWTKNADGTITVLHQGRLLQGNITYQPVVSQMPQVQTPTQTTPTVDSAPITTKPIVTGQSALVKPSEQPNRLTAADIEALYQKMQDQQNAKIDYTVQQAVDELNRAQEDAQKGFADQRNKVNIEEAQARDAEVLYAAARGDRGGITGRQYNSINNTAANNRAAINQAQQQLATDTARQIADLRAQGEFEKADALLQIAQQQLAQLWELQQYNDNLIMQEQQMAMQESQLTGQYNGTPTIDVQLADREFDYNVQQAQREWEQALKEYNFNVSQSEREWAYEIAMQSISAGIVPTADILSAAGIDSNTASQMASIYKASLTASKKTTGGGATATKKMTLTTAQNMAEAGQFTDEVLQAFYDAGYNDAYLYEMYGYDPTGTQETPKKQSPAADPSLRGADNPNYSANRDNYDPSADTSTNNLTVDMASVLALGQGPLSATQLANMVGAGIIREYVEGNKIKYALVGNSIGSGFNK